jgi:type VI secretion system secreted protein Hcp
MCSERFYSYLSRIILGLTLLLPVTVWAAGPIFVSVEGQTQGLISGGAGTEDSVGSMYVVGHEDEIFALGFGHNITIPRDPQSGQPTGSRVHNPLRIYKFFDKASPLLYQALVTGEPLTKVELKFYRTSTVGAQEHFYTITLEDAVISDISSSVITTSDGVQEREVVSFSYRKITWTNEITGTASSDDWRSSTL